MVIMMVGRRVRVGGVKVERARQDSKVSGCRNEKGRFSKSGVRNRVQRSEFADALLICIEHPELKEVIQAWPCLSLDRRMEILKLIGE